MILKSLGTRNTKGINRIAIIGYGHLCLREENSGYFYKICFDKYTINMLIKSIYQITNKAGDLVVEW